MLGEAIAAARKARGWSMEQLAVASDLTRGSIFQIERGAMPNVANLLAIAEALGTSVGELLGEDTSDEAALERALPGWGRLDAPGREAIRTLVQRMAGAPELAPQDRAAVDEFDRDARARTQPRRRIAEDGQGFTADGGGRGA